MNYTDLLSYKLISHNGRNSTRIQSILEKNPQLKTELIQATSFLPDDAAMPYRIHAIKSNLNKPYRCQKCNISLSWQHISSGFCSRKCNDLHIADGQSLTRKQLASQKMVLERSKTDKNGLSSFRKASQILALKLSEPLYDNGPTIRQVINQNTANLRKQNGSYNKAMNTRRKTLESTGIWTPRNKLEPLEMYRYYVSKVTEIQPFYLLENYDLRELYGGNSYHIDHMFSVTKGFFYNIPPYIIGNICNLQILTKIDNIKKNNKCSISKDELFSRFFTQS